MSLKERGQEDMSAQRDKYFVVVVSVMQIIGGIRSWILNLLRRK